jgi:hypothetical protein
MASLGSATKYRGRAPQCQRHRGLPWDERTLRMARPGRGVRGEIVRLHALQIELRHMWCSAESICERVLK